MSAVDPKIPWDELLVASVRVIPRHYGLTCGSLVADDTDNQRSKSAKTLAHLYKLRDKESGGYVWGQSLLFLLKQSPGTSDWRSGNGREPVPSVGGG